ncbi:MAG: cytochrome c3 family protein, partial [Bdellovibrionota bacterium]
MKPFHLRKTLFFVSSLISLLITMDAFAKGDSGASAQGCVTCHQKTSPGIVGQWKESRHSKEGISCIDCHGSTKERPDAFMHEGTLITTIVTPKDCATCHDDEATQ